MRITASLLDAQTSRTLWSNSYIRELDDVFAIQRLIATAIVAELGVRLNTAESLRFAETDTDTYRAYQLARQQLALRTAAGLRRAIELFEEAYERDPTYAPALAGAAFTHVAAPRQPRSARTLFARHTWDMPLRGLDGWRRPSP